MIKIYILLSLLFSNLDYMAPTFYEMIDDSDLIIYSKIIGVNESTIKLEIYETLKGKTTSKYITIAKFEDWTCAQRYDEYKVDQKQIFILKYHEYDKLYHVISAGNEGEMIVVDGWIYVKAHLYVKNKDNDHLLNLGFTKFDLNTSMIGLKQMIQTTKEYPSEETNCCFLELKFFSGFANFIFEEHLVRGKFRDKCEEFKSFDFRIIDIQ